MKANLYGIQVEGTVEEILAFKATLDQQQSLDEQNPNVFNVKIFHQSAFTDASVFAKHLQNAIKRNGLN